MRTNRKKRVIKIILVSNLSVIVRETWKLSVAPTPIKQSETLSTRRGGSTVNIPEWCSVARSSRWYPDSGIEITSTRAGHILRWQDNNIPGYLLAPAHREATSNWSGRQMEAGMNLHLATPRLVMTENILSALTDHFAFYNGTAQPKKRRRGASESHHNSLNAETKTLALLALSNWNC